MPPTLPIIAVTTGDPAGIGPEIVAHLFSSYTPEASIALVIGAAAALDPWAESFGLDCPVAKDIDGLARLTGESPCVVRLDSGVEDRVPVAADSAAGGRHAGRAIELACELANNGPVGAIVTAPISKKSLNLADFEFLCHTEMLARKLNAPKCQMMMVHKELRVVPLTRHLPLREVADAITADAIATCVTETVRGLQSTFGVRSPRVAVAGLNPHAGDDGVIGTEDRDVIAPALNGLRAHGIDIDGPVPADAMFQSVLADIESSGRPRYDTYITMYHDQGLVPFKMLAQRRGVNVTIGLPVVRTSVDHGAAYDIAGKGIAETGSLLEAYELAEGLIGSTKD